MKATCTWGDGPDVLVNLDGKRLMCYENPDNFDKAVHGFISEGSFELNAMEAIDLALQMIKAATGALELNNACDIMAAEKDVPTGNPISSASPFSAAIYNKKRP